MPDNPRPALRIGELTFHPASHELEREGTRVRLAPRLAALLERLAATPGEVVTREQLVRDVWQRSYVDDDLLSRNIAELRRALGDPPRAPRCIETIPKSGYRLAVAVVPVGQDAAPATAEPATSIPPRRGVAFGVVALALVLVAALALWAPWRGPARDGLARALAAERPLSSEPGQEGNPALSSDGALVAYVRIAPGAERASIVLRSIDGGAQRELTDPHYSFVDPAFSPDGTRLAFVRRRPGECELHVAPVLGGASQRLAACATAVASGIDWSADGSAIAYTAPENAAHGPGISLYRLGDARSAPLTQPGADEGPDLDPRFEPGGRRVSFARGEPGIQRLLAVAIAAPHALAELRAGDNRIQGHAWAPDGSSVVLASDEPGYRALLQLDVRTGAAHVVGGRGGAEPAIARNGELVYALAQYDANVWHWQRGAAQAVALRSSTRYDASPAFAPGGERYAYVSTRDDHEGVWIARTDGSGEFRLPLDSAHRWTTPAWSPDGNSLLLTRYDADTTWTWRHELDSARTQRLDALGPHAYAAQFAGGGATIVFARRGGPMRKSLWAIPSDARDGGAARELAPVVDQFRAGADVVVYSLPRMSGLQRIALGGGAPSALALPIDDDNRYDWTLANDAVWYAVRDGERVALVRHALADGASEVVTHAVYPTAVGPTLSVSADGKQVLFARLDELRIDLMRVPGAFPPAR